MNQPAKTSTRIAIVGTGNVGATFAYSLLLSGVASEIVLIDVNRKKAEGEMMDLAHAMPFTLPAEITVGDYSDCAGAAVTVITAGVNQKPGETRLDLLKRNADIFGQIVPEVARHNPEGILLIATNPVDVLTYVSFRVSGLPRNRVIGSGTILDTARFRYLLGEHFAVEPRNVHAYIVGEHGDSEVPVWSRADIAGMGLDEFGKARGVAFGEEDRERIFTQTRDAAYRIIERKGATYYAVATGLMRIVEAILRDQNSVLSVSSLMDRDCYHCQDVCLSLPSIINRNGVDRVLHPSLSEEEERLLHRSADILREMIGKLGI